MATCERTSIKLADDVGEIDPVKVVIERLVVLICVDVFENDITI